ncbi:MAG: hypothetical protein CGU28_04395 [Candidatus Dactylopiibacterium carminicum]|uniref:AraC family transcriptional regulator n=1 Tax=Candidatus Dactylopiibacterium carminicum TaxID=857335 RepID=A0A272EWT3_9RHOO|nr:AraC family transcriptional regulator [Candidatus Dactylopiibacterium carminicum]KAF7600045.1 AraC family transcriptional regulator [Candidatus Dactylopiibacterium carminicum]PAS94565.1 MAG: hypothetical protein CGU29_03285 [Candidatus Dactylopiibacterium carminicum]PAS97604.1 MAG: hypothetical protein CGU28_04395 [Candidatus Dactylopiibacterium carminicum]PAT00049.1 MAG: hypothetical protein BSR46_04735 [Candidatus Dactylopiibacterium carminicum]
MTLNFAAFCQRQARFRRLTDFIGASLDEDMLRVQDLADIACLSPAHLMRLYRARTGEGPMQTVRRLRLLRAREQLCHERQLSVTQIAFAAAYDSNAAFSHAFRRQFGIAPSQFRLLQTNVATPPPLWLTRLAERKVWQFHYTGAYGDNAYYKARLAWLCLAAGSRRWRGWRRNDPEHPFAEHAAQRVDLCHFVPLALHPQRLAEADLVTHAGGLYVVAEINPAKRDQCMATLATRLRTELHCTLGEGPSLEQDLQVRDFHPPQERRIALYLPVSPLGRRQD